MNARFKIKDSKFGERQSENFKYKYKKHSGLSSQEKLDGIRSSYL